MGRSMHLLAELYPCYTGIALFTSFLLRWRHIHLRGREARRDGPCLGLMSAGLCMFANAALSHVLKGIVRQPRPGGVGYGFPSAHSCWAAGLATILLLEAYELRREGRALPRAHIALPLTILLCGAALVPVSRVLTLDHTPGQALWGTAIGAGTAVLWHAAARASSHSLSGCACAVADAILGHLGRYSPT